jgi:hypothetical protein
VQREKERAKAWREENEEEGGDARGGKRRRTAERDDEDNPARDGKVFFKPGEKRKVAFMKGEVSWRSRVRNQNRFFKQVANRSNHTK